MELLPYITVLVILSSLLTLARGNLKVYKTDNGIMKKKYSIIGIFFLFISYIIFILFSAFRVIDIGLGGIDALAYKNIFHNVSGNIIESLNYQFYEPGYATIIWFAKTLSDNYSFALTIIYSIMFLFLIRIIKEISWSKYTPISIFLLLTLWLSSFNTVRTILAIFIATSVYIFLSKREYKRALLLTIFAISIHVSSVILIPIIFIVYMIDKKSKFSILKLISMIIILTLIFLFSIAIIENLIEGTRYEAYLYNEVIILAWGTYLISFISFIFSLIKYKELIKLNQINKVLVIVLPISLSLIIVQINFPIAYRMVLFFIPILYIIIPDIIRSYKIKTTKDFIYFPIKIGLFLYLIYRLYIYFTLEIISVGIPYQNMLYN